ncbi:hypothetical protein FNF31_00892 [Cafeteria roenbergensis]|uniref:RanBP2-type domain-containing protein n=1 Tax=Cafeteria roenbergensis TaxID=33653 RepID=A0A5A8DPT0_CAFRO|nr:hypothetical protein FNF31_00892 [Cafeteria roenbergensis]
MSGRRAGAPAAEDDGGGWSTAGPFLQVVVLFASDNKVLQYAKNVQARFTRHGIDVFMQTNLSEVGLARGKGPHWIRPSHLSMVISATKADFLIVVGDRNMRNETCQGRRSGKLVEMGVTERITAVLQSWARDHSVDSADAKGAEGLDSLQLSDRLHTYAGVGRALDRVERLEADAAAAARWRPPVRRAGSILSDHDAEMASLVTQVQTQGIRLHRELSSSLPILTELPVLPKGASLAQTLAFRMGLGIGRQVRASFRPTAETLHEPRPSGHIPSNLRDRLVSVTKELSERLEVALDDVAANAGGPHSLWGAYKQQETAARAKAAAAAADSPRARPAAAKPPQPVEAVDLSSRSAAVARSGGSGIAKESDGGRTLGSDAAAMAQSEPEEARKSGSSPAGDVVLEPGQWQCSSCTFVNEPAARACAMCGSAPPGKESTAAAAPAGKAGSDAWADDGGWQQAGKRAKGVKPASTAAAAVKARRTTGSSGPATSAFSQDSAWGLPAGDAQPSWQPSLSDAPQLGLGQEPGTALAGGLAGDASAPLGFGPPGLANPSMAMEALATDSSGLALGGSTFDVSHSGLQLGAGPDSLGHAASDGLLAASAPGHAATGSSAPTASVGAAIAGPASTFGLGSFLSLGADPQGGVPAAGTAVATGAAVSLGLGVSGPMLGSSGPTSAAAVPGGSAFGSLGAGLEGLSLGLGSDPAAGRQGSLSMEPVGGDDGYLLGGAGGQGSSSGFPGLG